MDECLTLQLAIVDMPTVTLCLLCSHVLVGTLTSDVSANFFLSIIYWARHSHSLVGLWKGVEIRESWVEAKNAFVQEL